MDLGDSIRVIWNRRGFYRTLIDTLLTLGGTLWLVLRNRDDVAKPCRAGDSPGITSARLDDGKNDAQR